jgi:hypothetical protein
MRCLFTMFAEDAQLIPKKSFENLLKQLRDTPKNFTVAMESLWKVMNDGGYAPHINTTLKKFNGGLFKDCRALPLEPDQIDELFKAAGRGWEDVEPAIFGTLLERALNPRERSKLGAHYTPRTYVERLVIPTIIEPLRADWQEVQDVAADLQLNGKPDEALAAVKAFHHKLCTTRVLDPACGTGNFLYVSLELMKRLEGDVLEALSAFGEDQARLALDGETVSPRQFYGLELNPRAVPIADLVLWLGYLKWQLKTAGLSSITEPVLHAYGTIKQQDAILKYDKQDVLKDDHGRPLSRWDGVTKKLHPITGEDVPDPDAQLPLYKYANPRAAPWPEVEFIVGNPPFIGAQKMRQELGDGYAESCWKARPHIPGGADFVMHFWDQAAEMLLRKGTAKQPNPLQRFGFITTNSITQTFSRRVIEHRMKGKEPLSLIFAVPDHPWLKASDKAAVRIAMTVAQKGSHDGVLAESKNESDLDTDLPIVEFGIIAGKIQAGLKLGANVNSSLPLSSNSEVCYMGYKLHGTGFVLSPLENEVIQKRSRASAEIIKPFMNGRDLVQRTRGNFVVDAYPRDIEGIRASTPEVYQLIVERVKPERDQNREPFRKRYWWWFGRTHENQRDATANLSRFLATCRTAKHRTFTFLSASTVPESSIVILAISTSELMTVLSSRMHILFSFVAGGWMGVGNDPVYQHTKTFDPFPFPDLTSRQSLSDRLGELGERLDSFRKERLAAHDFLTITGLYNALERYRELNAGIGAVLSPAERDVHEAGLISVLAEIHDDIDRATLSAYGWDDLASALVGKVGGTVPSDHKSEAQLAAEETLLTRLVALNHERAEEEKRELIRWLRPEYQIPKLGAKAPRATTQELDLDITETTTKPKWPTDAHDQIRRVRDVLAKSEGLASADGISAAFEGRNSAARKTRVARVLETLVITGAARTTDDGAKYFVAR